MRIEQILFKLKQVTLVLGLMTVGSAQAVVDMKNANFADTWVDIILPGSGYDLRVTRFYNSRSLFNGMFGFGWCSDFETQLKIMPEGSIRLTECGAGQEIIYQKKGSDHSNIQTIADKIVAIEKQKPPRQKTGYWNLRRQKIIDDNQMRGYLAQKYKLTGKVSEGTIYSADGNKVDSIKLRKGVYTRRMEDGTFQKFDAKGRLIQINDRNGNFLKLTYKNKRLKEMQDNNGRSLTFRYHKNKKIREILGPNGLKAKYEFKGVDDLVKITNAWGNSYVYAYDRLHNLTKIIYPDKTSREINYDKKRDWVTGFKDRTGCKETYKYELSKTSPRLHYWSTVQKKCGKEIVTNAKYEFWYKRGADSRVYLHRAQTKLNNRVRDIVYHSKYGKPVSISENGYVSQFEYYENGLLKARKTPQVNMQYTYNKINKVSKLLSTFYSAPNKISRKRTTNYKYSKKGNLTFAENTDGQKISLSWDNRGRISTIQDQAKRLIKIKYEERFGKPAYVTRPGLGTIKVVYNSKGDIKKVSSKEGPMVAMQVASAFNNLLDIIGPAATHLNLN